MAYLASTACTDSPYRSASQAEAIPQLNDDSKRTAMSFLSLENLITCLRVSKGYRRIVLSPLSIDGLVRNRRSHERPALIFALSRPVSYSVRENPLSREEVRMSIHGIVGLTADSSPAEIDRSLLELRQPSRDIVMVERRIVLQRRVNDVHAVFNAAVASFRRQAANPIQPITTAIAAPPPQQQSCIIL